jgi:hypothetical protein
MNKEAYPYWGTQSGHPNKAAKTGFLQKILKTAGLAHAQARTFKHSDI